MESLPEIIWILIAFVTMTLNGGNLVEAYRDRRALAAAGWNGPTHLVVSTAIEREWVRAGYQVLLLAAAITTLVSQQPQEADGPRLALLGIVTSQHLLVSWISWRDKTSRRRVNALIIAEWRAAGRTGREARR